MGPEEVFAAWKESFYRLIIPETEAPLGNGWGSLDFGFTPRKLFHMDSVLFFKLLGKQTMLEEH